MKPTIEKEKGLVKAAVFEREVEGKNGKFVSRSVSLQQSYKDKNDEWQNPKLTILEKNLRNTINVLEEVAQEIGC